MGRTWRRVAVGVAVLGFALFAAVVWALASGWAPLAALDTGVSEYFAHIAATTPGWVGAWDLISDVAGPVTWAVAAGVGVLSILIRHRRDALPRCAPICWFLVIGVCLGSAIPWAMKLVVDRPRPPGATLDAFGSSFPSGHAFGVTIAAGAAIVLGSLVWRGWRWWVTVAGALAVLALVCLARLALAVHYVSDVLAGVGLGAAWIATLALVCFAWPRRSPSTAAEPGGRSSTLATRYAR